MQETVEKFRLDDGGSSRPNARSSPARKPGGAPSARTSLARLAYHTGASAKEQRVESIEAR